jgi:DNA repair ATPase RecN
LRRSLDAQGAAARGSTDARDAARSFAAVGALLVDLHGQHAQQALLAPMRNAHCSTAFGGFTALTRAVGDGVARMARCRRIARHAAPARRSSAAERERSTARCRELAR